MDRHLLVLFFITLCGYTLFGQTDVDSTRTLAPIQINATRISTTKLKQPYAIASYQATPIQQTRQQVSLQEYINHIPGVFSLNANNYAQDLRISIRGFGSRAAFGIRGVKIIVDGIPETTPDGQGQIDNINLGIIQRIEVLKGPSSALYGNASGGVINIQTQEKLDHNFLEGSTTFGSYGLQQYQLKAGVKFDKTKLIAQGTHTTSTGYRAQSELKNTNINLRLFHELSAKSKLDWQINYANSPEANDPGGINLEDAMTDRRQARQRNVDFNAGESITQFKVGGRYRHELDTKKSLQLYGFYANRDFEGLLPFENGGWVALQRNYFGQGGHYKIKSTVQEGENTLLLGYELAYQQDNRQRFLNQEGIRGGSTLDQIETFSTAGIYVLDHFQYEKWLVTAGLRLDLNHLEVADELLVDGSQSGDLDVSRLNPSIGINYELQRDLHVYGSYRSSFETPSLSELSANPSGAAGFNTSLKPQKSDNYEIGLKGVIAQVFDFDVTLFHIDTRNDLVPFEVAAFPGRSFFRNAGSTSRDGVEVSTQYLLTNHLTIKGSYALSSFKYKDYLLPSGDFEDNSLPGIPEHSASFISTYASENGFYTRFQHRYVGQLFLNDANDVHTDGYHLTDLSVGYRLKVKGMTLLPFFGVNNIFGTRYNDNVRINAFGSRYYEPAPDTNVYGGIRVRLGK